jgi:YidC/Oxa1 family membrane protein insertase
VVDEILNEHGNNPSLKFVNLMGDKDSLFGSDILICDWSSTSIEYALGLEKPVLYIDVPRRVRNPNYMELGLEPMEVSIRNEVGMVLKQDNLENAPQMIDKLLSDPDLFREKIATIRKKIIFNCGQSVETGAAAIANIAATIKEKRTSTVVKS